MTQTKAVFDLGTGEERVEALTTEDVADLEALRPTLAQAKAMRCHDVDLERDGRMAAGVPYNFPDGLSGTIDTRHVGDMTKILGLVATAQRLMQTAPAQIFTRFRDAENIDHPLTPRHMLALHHAVAERDEALFEAARAIKDAIRAAADQDALDAIDITAGWPA